MTCVVIFPNQNVNICNWSYYLIASSLISHFNSFEDWPPIDLIYGCSIPTRVVKTWIHDRVPSKARQAKCPIIFITVQPSQVPLYKEADWLTYRCSTKWSPFCRWYFQIHFLYNNCCSLNHILLNFLIAHMHHSASVSLLWLLRLRGGIVSVV